MIDYIKVHAATKWTIRHSLMLLLYSAHAPLNHDDGGLLPDAYLHLVRKKRPLISDHIKGPLVTVFRSPLMKALDRNVETLGLWIVTSSVTFIKTANQSSIKLCQMIDSYTDTLISCLCVICAIHYWHLTGHAEEMQQESQGKRSLARKQVAGIITHLFTF